MNYYCLIAGLPDLHAEDTKSIASLALLKEEMLNEVSTSDAELIKLVFTSFDNVNFLAFLKNKEVEFQPLGNLVAEDFAKLLADFHEEPNIQKRSNIPLYLQQFYLNTIDEAFSFDDVSHEDYLAAMYYEHAMNCKNEFLQQWFEFNLNINNLLTAIACRKHGFNHKSLVIGNNEIANAIRQSNARDFGLVGLFNEFEVVSRIADENDLLEREKKIDALKWAWLEENTFFKYFSVEKILVYVLKTQMLERWKLLPVEKGTRIFRELLGELKKGVSFNSTF